MAIMPTVTARVTGEALTAVVGDEPALEHLVHVRNPACFEDGDLGGIGPALAQETFLRAR